MNWTLILERAWPAIVKLFTIVFSTLGIVYMCGRLLFPKLKDRGKNVIAFIALIVISYAITLVWGFPGVFRDGLPDTQILGQFVLEGALYAALGTVPYIVVGWRFYPRVDAFLDKKFAKDTRKKKR